MTFKKTRYVAPEQKLGEFGAGRTKNLPDSKCAEVCSAMVATRAVEYLPPLGISFNSSSTSALRSRGCVNPEEQTSSMAEIQTRARNSFIVEIRMANSRERTPAAQLRSVAVGFNVAPGS